MIEKIRKIYLYVDNSLESEDAKKWLDDNEISHEYLWYAGNENKRQHEEVFKALSTWTFGNAVEIKKFPFVLYNEMHDNGDVIIQCLYGLDNIKNSNLKELLELG